MQMTQADDTGSCQCPHLLARMLKGAVKVASSFFMVQMSNVRSRQLLVAICSTHTTHDTKPVGSETPVG
jgi:hypothetical protein